MKSLREEAIEIVEITQQGGLSKVQEIARNSGYQLGYIKDVGHKLWQSLSKAFGQKITKNNLKRIIHQYKLTKSYPATECQISQTSTFDTELANLEQWVVGDRCRLVSLCGIAGIGKTSLAAVCAEKTQHVISDFYYSLGKMQHRVVFSIC